VTPAELRHQSNWILNHARQLREVAELARLRAIERRGEAKKALASLREKRGLSEAMLNRHPHRGSALAEEQL
jgi:hypothetical protein